MQIFLKKNAFFGEKDVFFCFFGGSCDGIRGDRDYRDYRDYSLAFLFLAGGGAGVLKGALLLCCFFLRFVAVLLPSFYRLFTVFVSRLKAAGIGQGDYKKNHRNCYV